MQDKHAGVFEKYLIWSRYEYTLISKQYTYKHETIYHLHTFNL